MLLARPDPNIRLSILYVMKGDEVPNFFLFWMGGIGRDGRYWILSDTEGEERINFWVSVNKIQAQI